MKKKKWKQKRPKNGNINENINEKININEEKKENQIIQIKPRESYLKEKMMKLNYSEKLLTNVLTLDGSFSNIS